jgi:hypothetical protein
MIEPITPAKYYKTVLHWRRTNEPLRIQLCKERRESWDGELLRWAYRRQIPLTYFVIGLLIGGVLM